MPQLSKEDLDTLEQSRIGIHNAYCCFIMRKTIYESMQNDIVGDQQANINKNAISKHKEFWDIHQRTSEMYWIIELWRSVFDTTRGVKSLSKIKRPDINNSLENLREDAPSKTIYDGLKKARNEKFAHNPTNDPFRIALKDQTYESVQAFFISIISIFNTIVRNSKVKEISAKSIDDKIKIYTLSMINESIDNEDAKNTLH